MGTLTFQAALGGSVNLLGPNTASNINFTLPSADGSSGQPLQTNGSGTLSFANLAIANGGTGVTSFTANQIHYGSFSQSANLTFDGTNLTLAGGTANGVTYLNGSKVLTSSSALSFNGASLTIPTGSLAIGTTVSGNYLTVVNGDTVNAQQIQLLMSGTNGVINATRANGTSPNILFQIESTEYMRLTSSGNVGIGTSSPAYKLDVAISSGPYNARFRNTSTATTEYNVTLWSQGASGSAAGYVGTGGSTVGNTAFANNFVVGTQTSSPLVFTTNDTERMRIDSSGNLLVGTSTTYGSERLTVASGSTTQACITAINRNNSQTGTNIYSASVTAAGTSYYLFVGQSGNGTTVTTNNYFVYGNGNVQNTNNSYGAISDIKLKENVVDATPKLANMMQVRVVNYNLKSADGYETHKQIGVVAQELEQVFPGMVEETTDRDVEGNLLDTTTKSVKYSVFVPMLIKCIQEQQTLITSLTARIEALEAK